MIDTLSEELPEGRRRVRMVEGFQLAMSADMKSYSVCFVECQGCGIVCGRLRVVRPCSSMPAVRF